MPGPGSGSFAHSSSPSRGTPSPNPAAMSVPIPDGVDLDAMLPSERRAFLQRLELQGTVSTPPTASTSPTTAALPGNSGPSGHHQHQHRHDFGSGSVPFTMLAGMHSLPRLSSISDSVSMGMGNRAPDHESALPTVMLSPPPTRATASHHHSLPRLLNGFGHASTSPPPTSFVAMDDNSTSRSLSTVGGATPSFQPAGLMACRGGSDSSNHSNGPSSVMSPPTVFDMDLSTSPTSSSGTRQVPIGQTDHYDNDFFSTPFSPTSAPQPPLPSATLIAPAAPATQRATQSSHDDATTVLTLAECAPTRLSGAPAFPNASPGAAKPSSTESVTLESLSQSSTGPRITSGLTLPSASTLATTSFNAAPAAIPATNSPNPAPALTTSIAPTPSTTSNGGTTTSSGAGSLASSASEVSALSSMFTRSMSLPHSSNLPPSTPNPSSATTSSGGLDQYILEAVVGVGAFSKVRLGVHRRTRRPVAIKLVEHKSAAHASSHHHHQSNASMSRHVAQNETAIFREVANGCASIVHCYDVIEADDPVGRQKLTALVLEYCPGGDLFDLLAYRHHEVTMTEAARIAWQVCSAVSYLHDRNVVHRDLKLENILLLSRTAPFHLKLSDFGLARHLANPDERITSRCGSEEYTAPEVITLSDTPYAPKPADMWSVGVILYAVLVGQLPFAQESRDVVVVENVAVVPDDSTPPVPTQPGPKRASALLRHLESKLALTQPPSRAMSTSPRIPEGEVLPDLPPTPTTPTHQMEFATSAPGSPMSTSPGGANSIKIVRRRSTRKAGRKALWHRIARAEFSFPDEALELPPGAPEPPESDTVSDSGSGVDSELGVASSQGSAAYPLLTVETKAVVRGLLDAKPESRLTARECCEAVPWVVGGKQ